MRHSKSGPRLPTWVYYSTAATADGHGGKGKVRFLVTICNNFASPTSCGLNIFSCAKYSIAGGGGKREKAPAVPGPNLRNRA